MRPIFYLPLILSLFISCKAELKQNKIEAETKLEMVDTIDLSTSFNEWLSTLNLTSDRITDTTKERAFELWAYSDELNHFDSDSDLFWYPSKDSSYYLITNYNRTNNHKIDTSDDIIQLKFLNRKTNTVYIGIALWDSLNQRSLDYYWYDSTSFFLTEKGETYLTKLKMGIDSIWTYKID